MQEAYVMATPDSMLHLLHRIGQVADVMFAKELGHTGLTARQFAVLSVLADRQTASQTDIVEATGIDRSTLADIVRRLVARGFLARKRSRHDARAYDVRLTVGGRAALEAARPAVHRIEMRMLRTLPAGKRDEFLRALSALIHTTDDVDPLARKPKVWLRRNRNG